MYMGRTHCLIYYQYSVNLKFCIPQLKTNNIKDFLLMALPMR